MKSGIIAITLGLVMMLSSIAFSQVPRQINYQGRLTDANGAPVADGTIDELVFSIFNDDTDSAPANLIWQERRQDVEVNNGLFSVQLGSVNPLPQDLFPANAAVTRWLQVDVNGEQLGPRMQIVSVAYAFRAGDADMVDGKHANELGGITSEDDPQVDNDLRRNAVPRWNAAVQPQRLVTGDIFNDPANGNVGIGTESPNPSYRLDVNGLVRAARYHDSESSTYFVDPSSDSSLANMYVNYMRDYGSLHVDGNVGIGTVLPTAGLDINRAGSDGSLMIRNSYVGGYTHFNHPDGKNYIRGTTIMADQGGNVGIGTASPDRLLEIRSPGTAYLRIRGDNASGDAGVLEFYDTSSAHNWQISMGDTSLDNDLKFYKGTVGSAGSQIMRIQDDGTIVGNYSLRIGSPAAVPWYLYPGDAAIYGNVFVGGIPGPLSDLWVQGDITYWGNLYHPSDVRMKSDQRQLEYGLTNVMALNPIRYNQAEWEINPETKELVVYPERISKTNEIGLAAQEVQKVIPEAVNVPEDETRQAWGLNYIKLIPVLIKAIQEQQVQIEEQKEINAAQEKKIKSLEERITALEQK